MPPSGELVSEGCLFSQVAAQVPCDCDDLGSETLPSRTKRRSAKEPSPTKCMRSFSSLGSVRTHQSSVLYQTRRWSTSPASQAPGHPPQAQQQSVWSCHRHTATVRGLSSTRPGMPCKQLFLIPPPLLPQHAANEPSTGGMPPRTEPPSKGRPSTFTNLERDFPVLTRNRGSRQPVSLLPKKSVRPNRPAAARSIASHLTRPKCVGQVVKGRKRFQTKTFQPPCRDLPDKDRRLSPPSRNRTHAANRRAQAATTCPSSSSMEL